MNSLNELFFNHSAAEGMTYEDILDDVQKYCTANHADTLSGETDPEQAKKLLKEFILQYLIKCSYGVEGMSSAELCENLYEDMAGFSFLKKWIYRNGQCHGMQGAYRTRCQKDISEPANVHAAS